MAVADVIVTHDFPRTAADITVPCWYCKERIAYLHEVVFHVARVAMDGTEEVWLTVCHIACLRDEET